MWAREKWFPCKHLVDIQTVHLGFALDIFDMPAEHGNATQAAANCHQCKLSSVVMAR